jgi:hypothetical protein
MWLLATSKLNEKKRKNFAHEILLCSVKIDGCVICHHATILDKAVMKDCEVAGGYTVDKDSKFTFIFVFVCIYL